MFDVQLAALDSMNQEDRICACIQGLELCARQVEQQSNEIERVRQHWLRQLMHAMGIADSAVQELSGVAPLLERIGGNIESLEVELSLDDLTHFLLINRKSLHAAGTSGIVTKTQLSSLLIDLKREANICIGRRAKAYEICNVLVYRLYNVDHETAESIRREIDLSRALMRRPTTEVGKSGVGAVHG